MNNEKKIYDPYYRIKTAHEMLVFGLVICDLLAKRKIDEGMILTDTVVDNIEIHPKWNKADIEGLVKNLRYCVLGNSFIAFDEALDDVFDKKPDVYSETDLDALRAIIYMLRCAIAHAPMTPRWKADNEKYRRKFRINEIDYELDMANLNDKPVMHRDYGALGGAFQLIQYAKEIVRRTSNKQQ